MRLHNVIDPPYWVPLDSVIISSVNSEVYSYEKCHCTAVTVSSLAIFYDTHLKKATEPHSLRLSQGVAQDIWLVGHLNIIWPERRAIYTAGNWGRNVNVRIRSDDGKRGIMQRISWNCRSQWPRGLRRRSLAARLLRLWVRIPLGAWMFVCCECCVLSGRGLCDGLIIRSEESYRLWCVVVCDQETS